MTRKISTLILMLAMTLQMWGASVSISVTPQRGKSRIEVGDVFYLSIEVRDMNEAPPKPDNMPGAKLMYFERTSESSSFSSVNGRTTQSYSAGYTATMRALKEGSYSYGPVTVGGVKSNKVNYSIGAEMPSKQSQATPGATGGAADDDSKPKYIGKGDSNLFLRASVSSTNAYEQQALVYTVKLYTTYDAIKFIGATDSPKFDGFVVEESKDISSSLTFETYQGKTYATAVIARYIIFPQMTGSLKVRGNNYTIAVDRREYFHDSFFGNLSFSTPLQLNVSPNDLVVNVKDLPEPKPADFSGAVGTFTLSSDLKSSGFKTNQAASIVYTLRGTGNIKYVQMPDLSALYPTEIEIYTPKTTQNVSVGSSNVSGSVTFDYSFMPLEEGEYKIPPVKLVYFNPATGQYETSVAKGYTIEVGKGKASAGDAARRHLKFESEFQKIDVSKLVKTRKPWVYTFGFWLWFLVPVVLLFVTVVSFRYYMSTHADMAAFNSKRADKLARRRLRKAAAAMKKGDSSLFYDELLTALWGYLGDKLKMPTSELMRDNVRQVLSERGISAEVTDRFITTIDNAEFAKYSSAAASGTLQEAYDEAADTINLLEKEFKNKPKKPMNAPTYCLALIVMAASALSANAAGRDVAALTAAADSAYAAGEYAATIESLKAIEAEAGSSSALYYDMGNCYAKSGDYGNALVSYIRSLRIDPGNREARANMNYIEAKVGDNNRAELKGKKISVDPDAPSFFSSIKRFISRDHLSDTWGAWAVVSFLLFIGCLAVYIFTRNVLARKIGFFGGFIFLGFACVALAFSFMAASYRTNEGVITTAKVKLRGEPSAEGKENAFFLTRGTRMEVLDSVAKPGEERAQWYKVRLNSDFVGWIETSDFRTVDM